MTIACGSVPGRTRRYSRPLFESEPCKRCGDVAIREFKVTSIYVSPSDNANVCDGGSPWTPLCEEHKDAHLCRT